VLVIVASILASVAVGVGVERWNRAVAQRLAHLAFRVLLYVLLPIVVVINIHQLDITTGVAAGIGLGYVVTVAVGGLAWLLTRRFRLPRPVAGASIASSLAGNTGYLGIPLASALLGAGAVPAAVAFDLAVSLPTLFLGVFGVAAAMGTKGGGGLGSSVRAFFTRNLGIPAAIVGLALPADTFSGGVIDASHVLVGAIAPLGFFALGVTMTGESQDGELDLPPRVTRAVAIPLGMRVLAPLLMLGLSALIVDVPDAYLLAAAMPCGLNTLTAAHVYGLHAKTVAAAIAWSTTLVLVVAGVVGAVT
jgi:malate permease and related proteins